MTLVREHPPTEDYTGDPPADYYPFKYPLDRFQRHGCKAIENNHNLLVCAHTGSGKTVLALYAIARCLALGKRCLYISPIKTLSNQKYKEFGEAFGGRVGILTGDIKIAPDAPCLIMTAEILRNFLVTGENSLFSMDNVSCVVLDEVHFINNEDRGHVWEEVIVRLDRAVQLVMLSATLSGPRAFVEWVADLKQTPCHLVSTVKRPVPLRHSIYWDQRLHTFLEGDTDWKHGVVEEVSKDIYKYHKKHPWTTHTFLECVYHLEKKSLLPATVFLLNRALVEKQAKAIRPMQTDHYALARIEHLWDKHLHKYAKHYETLEQWHLVRDLLFKGVGIHHSGMIPVLKEIVEITYTEGLIPVLLATETFALGVNAPTKTTIFTSLSKFDGRTKRDLYSNEYLQMAGRAGRRGLDDAGTIVILPHPYMPSEESLRQMVMAPPQAFTSRLALDFSTILQGTDHVKGTLFYRQQGTAPTPPPPPLPALEMVEDETPERALFEELMRCEQSLIPDGYIRLDKKKEKAVRKRITELRKLLPNLHTLVAKETTRKRQENAEKEALFHEARWGLQSDTLTAFLKKEGFMDEVGSLTKRGVVFRSVHDGNAFLLSRLLDSNLLDDLEPSSMVAVFSMFVAEKEKEDLLWEEVGCPSPVEKACAEEVFRWAAEYKDKELVLVQDLPFVFAQDWALSRTMMRAARDWYEGKPWYQIRQYHHDFEGNFIKNVLRLTNFIQSLYQTATLVHHAPILQHMEDIQTRMVRDMVMNVSLYVVPSV
jgi:superfamily II RNA helicase